MPLMDKSSRLLTSPMSKVKTKRTDSAQSGSTNGGASGTDELISPNLGRGCGSQRDQSDLAQRLRKGHRGTAAPRHPVVRDAGRSHGCRGVSLQKFESFDRVAVGFPGVIVGGIVKQAPNLAKEWQGFNIADVLQARLKKPVRVANDADVQGFGAISGRGVEVVVTLGTGVGTSLFVDGRLVPNLEIGKDKLRNAALHKVGKKKWNKRLVKFIRQLDEVFHFTRLYIGGGNSREVDVGLLPAHVTIISNLNGLVGGIALWRDAYP